MTDAPNTSAVTRQIALNAARKLKAGGSVTKDEREVLEQIEQEQSDAKKPMRSSFGDAVRWTVDKASIEFGLDTKTLVGRLRRGNHEPGEDKRYSTAQIAAAVYGDQKVEYARLTRTQADIADVALAKMQGDVVPVQACFLTMSNMLFAIRRLILMSPLPKETQDACIKELADLKPSDFVTEETSKEMK